MQKKIRARLDPLPKTEASFVEPMECLSGWKLPEGLAKGRSQAFGEAQQSRLIFCEPTR